MDAQHGITVSFSLTEAEAMAYAQFLKRVGYREYYVCAVDVNEAYTMQRAGEKIREALAEKGFAPR